MPPRYYWFGGQFQVPNEVRRMQIAIKNELGIITFNGFFKFKLAFIDKTGLIG